MTNGNQHRELARDILEARRRAWTVAELHDELMEAKGVDVVERTVENVLKDLMDAGEVERQRFPTEGRGQNPYRYYHVRFATEDEILNELVTESVDQNPPETGSILEDLGVDTKNVSTTGEQRESREGNAETTAEEETQSGALYDIAEEHLEESATLQEVKEVAPALTEEDPVGLLIDLCEWSMRWINELGRRMYHAYDEGRLEHHWKLERRVEGLLEMARWYFVRVLALDTAIDADPRFNEERWFQHLPSVERFYRGVDDESDLPQLPLVPHEDANPGVDAEREAIREHLESRIHSDAVLSAWDIGDVEEAAGTDGSVADIDIPNRRQPLGRETNLQLFTGAAALERSNSRYTDYDFEPERLREYRDREAFEEGYLMSPRVLPELGPQQFNKSRQAAMFLRQANENEHVARDTADWHPVGEAKDRDSPETGPDVIFADGRIFPLVHRFQDYKDTRIYGDLIRNEVKKFAESMRWFGAQEHLVDSDLVGVVKGTMLTVVAPLVFWYLRVEQADIPQDPADVASDEELELDQVIPHDVYNPRMLDTVISNVLFMGLVENADDHDLDITEDRLFCTFRIERRFWEVSVPNADRPPEDPVNDTVIDVHSPDDWTRLIGHRAVGIELDGGNAAGVNAQRLRELEREPDIDLEDPEEVEAILDEVFDPDPWRPFTAMCAEAATSMVYGAPHSLYIQTNQREAIEDPRLMLPRFEAAVLPAGEADGETALRKGLSWFAEHPKLDYQHPFAQFSSHLDPDDEGLPIVIPEVVHHSDRAARMARNEMGPKVRLELREIIENLRSDGDEDPSDSDDEDDVE